MAVVGYNWGVRENQALFFCLYSAVFGERLFFSDKKIGKHRIRHYVLTGGDMVVKAIETTYAGYRMRSRLEARWGIFFDTLGFEHGESP
jgi:hypothetical protein